MVPVAAKVFYIPPAVKKLLGVRSRKTFGFSKHSHAFQPHGRPSFWLDSWNLEPAFVVNEQEHSDC